MTYSWDEALKRVEALKRSGIWPGIVFLGGGRFRLTYDPQLIVSRLVALDD